MDVPDELFASDSEFDTYCFCKSDLSDNMIECEGPNCKIKFYHLRCVRLNVPIDDGPSDWICSICLGKGSPNQNDAPVTRHIPDVSPKQDQTDNNELGQQEFTLEKALTESQSIIKDTIDLIKNEPFCQLNGQFVELLSITSKMLAVTDVSEDCTLLIKCIWGSVIEADNTKQLISTKLEKKASSFHRIRGSEDIKIAFKSLMLNLKIDNYSDMIGTMLLLFLIQRLFQELLKRRHTLSMISAQNKPTADMTPISATEEQALRYTAGFICRKLCRHFARFPKNAICTICWKVLQNFKISDSETDIKNVLSYTKEWLNIVNRGGLFSVSDNVYIFFREMEVIVRSNLNKSTSSLKISKQQLQQQLENSESVNQAFVQLTGNDEHEDIQFLLLAKFIKCWINLRLKAFSNVYMYLQKKKENTLSRTAQKSLRKEMDKENRKRSNPK